MRNLLLAADEFDKEIEVVKEERRLRVEDSPQSYTYEAARAMAFHNSPYRHPIIGWMSDLEQMQIGDLEDWYQRWYHPGNATLVVVGAVDTDAVLRLAEQHFGPIPAGPAELPTPRRAGDPRPSGARRVTVKRPARQPFLVLSYQVPSLVTAMQDEAVPAWTPYALEVLSGVLSGGKSARLQSRLVRGREIAAGIGAGYSLYARLPTLFSFSGTPAQGRTVAELEAAVREEIEHLVTHGVEAAELQRVKNQAIAADVYERDSIFYQALLIGILETVGPSWEEHERYVERVRAVTAEQVVEVARRYLRDDTLTVAELEPQPLSAAPPPRPRVTARLRAHGAHPARAGAAAAPRTTVAARVPPR